jgi:hypothetical protein
MSISIPHSDAQGGYGARASEEGERVGSLTLFRKREVCLYLERRSAYRYLMLSVGIRRGAEHDDIGVNTSRTDDESQERLLVR